MSAVVSSVFATIANSHGRASIEVRLKEQEIQIEASPNREDVSAISTGYNKIEGSQRKGFKSSEAWYPGYLKLSISTAETVPQ